MRMRLRKVGESTKRRERNEERPHEVEQLFIIKTCLTDSQSFCGNVKGQSVKKRQKEDKVQQKGHERC